MKEECKLCCVNGWCGSQGSTDFSISSLMRPAVQHSGQMEPRHDAVLLSAYLFKLGYYQPAGPLIKESGAEAERALARYHPPPHYHSPHPPMLQQYGPPYYSAELCYGRYYRPPGSYHIPPPQPDGQMVGVGSEPYPPQYYGSSPCYQHSPQRIPYVEYRGCPCPLNACPKNVLIGPATGKAPAGGGPADVSSSLAPPGGSFRPKVRACVLDSAADTHGSGKDPPLEPEPLEPPTAADAPHQCPLPAIGGASPKRELYDVRESLRLNADIPEPTEAIGPPSPARGACAPQPTPSAPRRARLGKAMARRSLAGDDTAALLNSGPNLPLTSQSDADDDVLAISPPVCVPIDLSSSDERSTPLVDIKKENEGPTYTTPRKADAQALREHNCTTALSDTANVTDSTKPIKRRYSKSKLEIEMKDVQLTDVCKTNCIGEHVKLQKRRKVSSDQIDAVRVETITKEPKKKATQSNKKTQKLSLDKKTHKRKSETIINEPKAKKSIVESSISDDPRLENVAAVVNEDLCMKPKTKSAVLLDNLLRKNSIDRQDAKGYSSDINPAELFLTSHEDVAESGRQKSIINDIIVSEICKKNIIYSNNKMTESNAPTNGVRPKTIAAVSQLIEKKLAFKNKMVKINSNITHSLKSVLTSPTNTTKNKEDQPLLENGEANIDKSLTAAPEKNNLKLTLDKEKNESAKENSKCASNIENSVKIVKPMKQAKSKTGTLLASKIESIKKAVSKDSEQIEVSNEAGEPKCMFTEKPNGEAKTKNVEKVVKLLVSKKPVLKCDEASLVMESACEPARGPRRRRSGVRRRRLAAPSPPLPMPRAPPRWSNGWNWDGDHYLAKVYLNNDTRLDRVARCWARMTHASGDYVSRGDCVLLRASPARAQPFVARVASLWENPDDGEMMVSLVWYYRPEHTARGRGAADAADEVFASGHRDANSVACIEDKCYVLTYNEYCRYKKRLRAIEEGITIAPSLVPPLPASELAPALAPNDTKLPPAVSPELVLFCRKIYDFRSKKIQVK